MRKLLIASVIAVAGCVTNPAIQSHTEALEKYNLETRNKVEAKEIKLSQAYEQLHAKTFEWHQATGVTRYRVYLAEMIPLARRMEAGDLKPEQFEDERRKRHSAMLQSIESDQKADAAQRQANVHNTLQSLSNNPLLQNRNQTTCTSQWVWNQWRTVCN
jgi:hypothetical protein